MAVGPTPVLVALHGAGDTGSNFIAATDLDDVARDNGLLLVAPDGYNKGWFVQNDEGWPRSHSDSSSFYNDVLLMQTILDDLEEDYRVDSDRYYLTGHSRGAGMTALVGIATGQYGFTSPFAAYGVNAGYDPAQGSIPIADADPKRPFWVIHGTSDSNVPFSYGEDLASSLERGGFEVDWTPVSGAGHTWLWRSSYGQTNQDLVDWFLEHPLP